MHYLANAAQILIEFFFSIAVGVIVLRVLLQLVRANFHNPICQFLYRISNPVLMPLRKLIPAWRRLDIAGVVLAWALLLVKRALIFALTLGLPTLPTVDNVPSMTVLRTSEALAPPLCIPEWSLPPPVPRPLYS